MSLYPIYFLHSQVYAHYTPSLPTLLTHKPNLLLLTQPHHANHLLRVNPCSKCTPDQPQPNPNWTTSCSLMPKENIRCSITCVSLIEFFTSTSAFHYLIKFEFATPTICLSSKRTQVCSSIFHPRADRPFPLSLRPLSQVGHSLFYASLDTHTTVS